MMGENVSDMSSNASSSMMASNVSAENATENVTAVNVTGFNPKDEKLIATKPVYTYELWILNVTRTSIDSFFAGNLSVNFNTSKLLVNCSIEFPFVNYNPPV